MYTKTVGPYTHHNNLLGKLQLLDIYDLTDRALTQFIADIQDRRTQARVSALYKKISKAQQKPKKRAKGKVAPKRKAVKRGNSKTKRLGVGDSKA